MRTFHLDRKEDHSGVSGTGIVAEGFITDTGMAVLAWKGELCSVNIYRSIEELEAIHGHGGKTVIVWGHSEDDR